MKIVNHGDEPVRISFFTNDLTNKTTVKYVHFVRGNTFFLNIGESLSVPVEFSFSQSTKKLESNFPIICEITSLKRMNSSFEPKFRMFFYISKVESHTTFEAPNEDDNSLFWNISPFLQRGKGDLNFLRSVIARSILGNIAISFAQSVILRSVLYSVRISLFKVFMKKGPKRWDPHALEKRGLRMTPTASDEILTALNTKGEKKMK